MCDGIGSRFFRSLLWNSRIAKNFGSSSSRVSSGKARLLLTETLETLGKNRQSFVLL